MSHSHLTSPNLSTAFDLLIKSVDMNTTPTSPPTLIACLESYLCPSFPIGTSLADETLPALHLIPSPVLAKLKNIGPPRLKDMRSLAQAKQVISHIPVTACLAGCAKFNDSLHTAIQLNNDRFAALAILPCEPGDGKDAAKELQRCIGKLKFVGGMIGGTLSETSLEELWSTAETYRVPIALRETWPTGSKVSV